MESRRHDRGLASLVAALEIPPVAELVKLRYYAGLTVEQAASVLKVNVRTAHRYWTYARVWLLDAINSDPDNTANRDDC